MDIIVLTVKKDIYKFILYMHKLNIPLFKIKYLNNEIEVYINFKDYEKIIKYKNIYNISIKKYIGLKRIKDILIKNKFMIISLIFGVMVFLILTNMIFKVEVLIDNDIKEKVIYELNKNGIKKYTKAKDYDTLEKIKKDILNVIKDIEWMSIKRIGTKYEVKAYKKKNYIKLKEDKIYKIVASKDALIKNITSSSGEIVVYKDKYVHKGDTLIDYNIKLNDEVKDIKSASGLVYGEVWYRVKIEYPIYVIKEEVVDTKKMLCIKFFEKDICPFFGNRSSTKYLIKNDILPIYITMQKKEDVKFNKTILKEDDALSKALEYSYNKMSDKLGKDEYIINQKSLKSEIKDSKIIVDVFYTIYENITEYVEIEGLDDIQR